MLILNNGWETVKVAKQLQISHNSAYEIIHDRFHFHKVCARCFPKLPEQHRHNCLDVCNHVLSRYHEEGDLCLLPLIVTGDETLIRHYEPERRPQNVEWKQTMSPVKTKFKSQPVTRKVMPILFWDSQGPVVEKLIWRF